MRKIINREQMLKLLLELKNKAYFDIDFKRVTPKCSECGAKSTTWKEGKIDVCPRCGGKIEYDCHAENVIYGKDDVENSIYCDKNLSRGLVLYLDNSKFRNARISNIYRIAVENNEYFVV